MFQLSRRQFLAASAAAGAAAGLAGVCSEPLSAAEPLVKGTPHADKLGWRVGFSAYSFRNTTTFEALDKIAATGLRFTELFSWQKLSPAHLDATPGPALAKTLRQELTKKAADVGVKMIGIYSGLDNADAAKAMFEFAAEMGIETIVSEPPEALFDKIAALAEEFKVDLALHNHPQPSHYWNPETGLAGLQGKSARLGFCCDTGHWCRCGLEPAAMLKKIGRRVKTFHLKDLDQYGVPAAKDVIWGQGLGRITEILTSVKELGIKNPYFGIEWERDPNEPLVTHAKSVAFLESVAAKLAG